MYLCRVTDCQSQVASCTSSYSLIRIVNHRLLHVLNCQSQVASCTSSYSLIRIVNHRLLHVLNTYSCIVGVGAKSASPVSYTHLTLPTTPYV